jgi:uncharacterized membrane protein YebE (DUF533 family)
MQWNLGKLRLKKVTKRMSAKSLYEPVELERVSLITMTEEQRLDRYLRASRLIC